jgi:methyl-accepting chemotaxis protein
MVHLPIARKLPAAIIAIGLLIGAGVGASGYLIASRTAQELTFARLDGLAADRSDLLRSYLASRELSVLTAARSETVQNALRDLHFGWMKIGDNPGDQLFDAYVTKNPNPESQRYKLADAGSGNNYDSAHSRVHPALQVLAQSAGFPDIYLFDNDGNAVYTVNKGQDFAGAFGQGGKFADTVLGHLIAQLKDNQQTPSLSDIAAYTPAGAMPSAFMAAPVLAKTGARAGTIAVRLPIAEWGTLINRHDGLGQTGEVIIVGADHLLRSESAFSKPGDVLETKFEGPMVDEALAGTQAQGPVSNSYRGEDMLVDAVPLGHPGINWAVVTMMGAGEAMGPVGAMGQAMLISALVLMVIAGIISLVVSRRVTDPITRLTATMGKLARGELDLEVPYAGGKDEIGDMARAVEVFRENGTKVAELTRSEAGRVQREQEARAQMMSVLQAAFGSVVEAAVAGDFSRKIDETFADAELNRLAAGINDLVGTVDRGLNETGAVLSALAEADLTRRMQGEYKGAFATLKADINKVADGLSEIISQLRTASTTLHESTSRIMTGSNDLSRRTALQSSTIEETTAAMSQLADTVLQNASRAKQASELAATLMRSAEESGDVMANATESMERITASSQKISSIIGLIDDIAFQTNLLALNASVEAARAGQAGEGFAVVAVEVRRLAQSAAKASSDVKGLIGRSADEVKGGSTLVASAAKKIEAMLGGARSSNDLMESIAMESREQASAIGNVSRAMLSLEEMTQHDAGLVEETTVAVSKAEKQVAEMDRLVDLFVIERAAEAPAVPPKRTAPRPRAA